MTWDTTYEALGQPQYARLAFLMRVALQQLSASFLGVRLNGLKQTLAVYFHVVYFRVIDWKRYHW